ncbi:ornithine carbamoyltransferase [Elusimicrobium posterum]|uniref:ornithine carbamoyltransferase n=1 Tax=Elusimicrobium posterum TaxID=3116653 RepID=UPI003C78ED68
MMKGKDLLSIHDLSIGEVAMILEKTKKLKKMQKEGVPHRLLEGKTLGMIFHKASTRTRVSFEVGFAQLGGQALYLDNASTQMGRGEPIQDTARVLARYLDGIMIRTFAQETVEDLAKYADVPVINGLTDTAHPCQALADIFTVMENFGDLKGRKLTYVGDGNNVANSLMYACAKSGMDITLSSPKGFEVDEKIAATARKDADVTGSKVILEADPFKAVQGADVIYTDVWASMGEEKELEHRKAIFKDYQVNDNLVNSASKDVVVMHCLPAHRGEEITDSVIEGAHSVIFDEAENRLHVQKAIMALLMSDQDF